ncbi:MAG: 50S ribosomal protein L28 [Clostridiaceae bacterium]|nr:50S ribosomal protein L28 [Clostridiaceae bacterium]
MAKCYICEKRTIFGNNVSHSIRRTSRNWKPNIKKVKALVDGSSKSIYVCARCLRSNKVTRAV